ncbi:MAG: 16S rRNA (guanine(527)-N(7))-methyltransferase RsmG [Flavobacteriales bacterium]|nr:16S rRNA (guanine(527)-N(7))-methyltransferase RsmG [Flavobacteriales bacterium]
MEIIQKYFPELSSHQLQQFAIAKEAYQLWNERINVISRKDIENIEERHFLHSLAIAKVVKFAPGTRIHDVGTGGGFPGIPLAIAFPQCEFLLIDSIGKKLKVVEEVVAACKLNNVQTQHSRAEQVKQTCDFVTGRAVETIAEFYRHVSHMLKKGEKSSLPNGILYLKGGDISDEIKNFGKPVKEFPISTLYAEQFFETKKIIFIPY